MNVTDLKAKYHSFLSTPKGKEQLLLAVALKRQWVQMKKETDIQIDTAGVKLNVINPNLARKIKKIDITPIGLNNMCHSTSQFFCDDENGITSKLGFNLTACPCGKMMCYEIHSVNKIGETLYDFTKDFNEEASKYFLEFDIDGNIDANTYTKIFGRDPIGVNNGCKCPIIWSSGTEYIKTETYLLNHIQQLETIRIHTY